MSSAGRVERIAVRDEGRPPCQLSKAAAVVSRDKAARRLLVPVVGHLLSLRREPLSRFSAGPLSEN
jgi:hypothetical protein